MSTRRWAITDRGQDDLSGSRPGEAAVRHWKIGGGSAATGGSLAVDGESDAEDLLAIAASHNQVPVELLRQLLALEQEFPDFTQFGSKAGFTRRVAQLLDHAASSPETA